MARALVHRGVEILGMILDEFERNLNEAVSDLTSQQRQDLAGAIGKPNVAIEWFDEPDVCAKARDWIEDEINKQDPDASLFAARSALRQLRAARST